MSIRVLRAFLDRIEGDLAVLLIEDISRPVHWPARELPEGVREGSVLRMTLQLDEAATHAAQDEIEILKNRLQRGE